jgi:MFS transporter, DHA1 family, multidrug resistance protein
VTSRLIKRPSFTALLLVTGTGALSTDAYVSSLPAVQASLRTSSSVTQLTMTAFIIGMAAGQLLSGPISDARGRRTMVLTACLAFTALSVTCALATSGWLLVGERALQGIAAGTAIAVGRAVVNDAFDGRAATTMFGTLMAVSLIGPVVAPPIGTGLAALGDWRTVFWFLALVGVAMWVAALRALPETLPPDRRHAGGLVNLGRRTADLLTDRSFVAPVAIGCLTTAGFFVYIGGSSFVLQRSAGVSAATYTLIFTTNATTMVASSFLFRLLVGRFGPVPLRRAAMITQTTAVAALFTITLLAPDHRPPLAAVWIPLAVMTAGLGMFLPSNGGITQYAGRRAAGTASALGGGLPFLAGALTTPLTGFIGNESVLVMASCMIFFFAAAAIVGVVLRRATLDPYAAEPPGTVTRAAAPVPG